MNFVPVRTVVILSSLTSHDVQQRIEPEIDAKRLTGSKEYTGLVTANKFDLRPRGSRSQICVSGTVKDTSLGSEIRILLRLSIFKLLELAFLFCGALAIGIKLGVQRFTETGELDSTTAVGTLFVLAVYWLHMFRFSRQTNSVIADIEAWLGIAQP